MDENNINNLKHKLEQAKKETAYYKSLSERIGNIWLRDSEKLSQFIHKLDVTQDALKKAHDQLEERVKERTAQLTQANEQLQREITERLRTDEEVRKLNEMLELRVSERTHELSKSNEALKNSIKMLQQTQSTLVQSEKNEAVNSLITGIAHEINTPVGNCITAVTLLLDITESIDKSNQENSLKRSDFRRFIDNTKNTSQTIFDNLQRAAVIITKLKQLMKSSQESKVRDFDLKEHIEQIIASMDTSLELGKYSITITDDHSDFTIKSFPGIFTQIFNNLITNSIIHGLENLKHGAIEIDLSRKKDCISIRYSDNGAGMDEETNKKIFEPFFTTRRGSGHTGLGMHFVYNLIVQHLKGQIECSSSIGNGIAILISIPVEPRNDTVVA